MVVKKKIYVDRTWKKKKSSSDWECEQTSAHVDHFWFHKHLSKVSQNFQQSQKKSAENLCDKGIWGLEVLREEQLAGPLCV